jgi:hypothetical protein
VGVPVYQLNETGGKGVILGCECYWVCVAVKLFSVVHKQQCNSESTVYINHATP